MKRKTFVPSIENAPKPKKKVNKDGSRTSKNLGGPRPGAGRKKGWRKPPQFDLDKALQQCMNKCIQEWPGYPDVKPTAVQIWRAVYLDETLPGFVRENAMKRCEKFESASIAPTEQTDPDAGKNQHRISRAREELKSKLSTIPTPTVAGSVDKLA